MEDFRFIAFIFACIIVFPLAYKIVDMIESTGACVEKVSERCKHQDHIIVRDGENYICRCPRSVSSTASSAAP